MKSHIKIITFLAVIMAVVFGGILAMQVIYIRDHIKFHNHQFEELVTGRLINIARAIEEYEIEKYLNSFFANGLREEIQFPAMQITDDFASITSKNNDEIAQLFLIGRQILKQKIIENMVISHLEEPSELPIEERIDFDALDNFIKSELEYDGIFLPFYFAIIDCYGNVIFISPDFEETSEQKIFEQVLFPNTSGEKKYFLKLFFPTSMSDYIMNNMTMIVKSGILIILLLVVFVATLLLIFNQKKLEHIKHDFVRNMTHEIKTPISVISLASQMMEDPNITKAPELLASISNIIKGETQRLSYLVEKILLMSIEHEKSSLKFKEIDINELIKSCAENFSIKAESKGGKLITNLHAENSLAMADELHFTNVILNLLDNAVKYSNEDPAIQLKISTWNYKDNLYIEIEDNGIGMKKEDTKRVFEKFYRISTGNVHNVKGFGLGLAYVKKIIDQHKGTISLNSELNKGTTFIIKIPIKKKLSNGNRKSKNTIV